MSADLECWRCGAGLAAVPWPLRREEVCPACNADLHVCRLCRFFNPRLSDGCDEPLAGGVTNKERANFCDYFEARAGAFRNGPAAASARARAELDALFDDAAGATPTAGSEATSAELARLFGLDEK